jgi:hypothetical protein
MLARPAQPLSAFGPAYDGMTQPLTVLNPALVTVVTMDTFAWLSATSVANPNSSSGRPVFTLQ